MLKLVFEIPERTISRLLPKTRKPPSQNWRVFLTNHAGDLVVLDFFTVPTISFRILYVFVILEHERRRVVHFNVTMNPTAFWAGQQMIEAFPEDTAPRYLLRDRDGIYGDEFRERVDGMGVKEVLTAPRSPWQNAFAERLIGSIRRECLDHVIVLNRKHLRRILTNYFGYYHRSRTHLGLDKGAPIKREVQGPELGKVAEFPELGGCTIATNAGPPSGNLETANLSRLSIGQSDGSAVLWRLIFRAGCSPPRPDRREHSTRPHQKDRIVDESGLLFDRLWSFGEGRARKRP